MAFRLNIGQPYRTETQPYRPARDSIHGVRLQLHLNQKGAYFHTWKVHIVAAALMFFMGLSIAGLQPSRFFQAQRYDMTPTGSIATDKAGHPEPKARSCD